MTEIEGGTGVVRSVPDYMPAPQHQDERRHEQRGPEPTPQAATDGRGDEGSYALSSQTRLRWTITSTAFSMSCAETHS